MDSNIRRRIPAIPSEHRPDLAWSLKPFIYSFRMVGIDLDVWSPRSKFKRYVSSIIGIIMMIFLCFAEVLVIKTTYENQLQFSDTTAVIINISLYLSHGSDLLLQFIIFKEFLFKWKELWLKLNQLERIFIFPETFYFQMRKVCVISTVMVFKIYHRCR